MKAFTFLLPVALAVSSIPSFGQIVPSMVTTSTRVLPAGEIEIRATYKMEPGPIPAFLDDPYSLKRVFQKNQVLADGTSIEKQTPPVLHHQDSAGRFRAEYPFRRPQNFPDRFELPPQVEIIDSVAGFHYIIDTVHRIAHRGAIEIIARKPLPPQPPKVQPNPPVRPPVAGSSAQPQRSTEPLGNRVIEGVPLEGKRTSTTFPAGSNMGNDHPVTITSEEWSTPGSTMPPFRRISDPRSGDETAASYDIVRGEPDPRLFQIPPDYQIVDEPGPFAVTYIFSPKTKSLR
jgi:hypothetical protein